MGTGRVNIVSVCLCHVGRSSAVFARRRRYIGTDTYAGHAPVSSRDSKARKSVMSPPTDCDTLCASLISFGMLLQHLSTETNLLSRNPASAPRQQDKRRRSDAGATHHGRLVDDLLASHGQQ